MSQTHSLEQVEALDRLLLQVERELEASTPESLAGVPETLENAVLGLRGVLNTLLDSRESNDSQMRERAQQIRKRTSRIQALIEAGERFCSTRLTTLGVVRSGYTATGTSQWEVPGTVEAEA